MKSIPPLHSLVLLILLVLALSGCTAIQTPIPTPDMYATAAAQATQIVLQAQTTAVVRQAQTRAAVLLATPEVLITVPQPNPTSPTAQSQAATLLPVLSLSPDADNASPPASVTEVTLVRVGYAADGAMLIVQFYAPYEMTRSWTQGNVYLIDEASGTLYNEIPVMPIIGPLLARPKFAGQLGYVMLTNTPGLGPGSLVTVVLGTFKQEHVLFQP